MIVCFNLYLFFIAQCYRICQKSANWRAQTIQNKHFFDFFIECNEYRIFLGTQNRIKREISPKNALTELFLTNHKFRVKGEPRKAKLH